MCSTAAFTRTNPSLCARQLRKMHLYTFDGFVFPLCRVHYLYTVLSTIETLAAGRTGSPKNGQHTGRVLLHIKALAKMELNMQEQNPAGKHEAWLSRTAHGKPPYFSYIFHVGYIVHMWDKLNPWYWPKSSHRQYIRRNKVSVALIPHLACDPTL